MNKLANVLAWTIPQDRLQSYQYECIDTQTMQFMESIQTYNEDKWLMLSDEERYNTCVFLPIVAIFECNYKFKHNNYRQISQYVGNDCEIWYMYEKVDDALDDFYKFELAYKSMLDEILTGKVTKVYRHQINVLVEYMNHIGINTLSIQQSDDGYYIKVDEPTVKAYMERLNNE